MKKTIWIILALVVVTAIVTCPDEQAHKTTLKSTTTAALNECIDRSCSDPDLGLLTSALGSALGGWAIDLLVENRVYVTNYFVCSIGYITWEGESKLVSVGCFGHVFSTNKDDMLAALDPTSTH
ncbi:MAG: hypothetical protein MJZ55_00870 [Paludibacteraceae bacterium]|nr:hypothetical protein [Paludibacteraceae bacterium]